MRVARDSKRERFERLLKPELDALYRTARRVIGHAALAEEAVQDCCLKAFAHFDAADEPNAFRPWLFRILMNQAIDSRRRQQRDLLRSAGPDCLDGVPDTTVSRHPLNDLTSREDQRALDRAVAALPDDLRALVSLVLIEELTYAQAADCLDISEDLVRSRLARVRIRLRALLASHVQTPTAAPSAVVHTIASHTKRVRP